MEKTTFCDAMFFFFLYLYTYTYISATPYYCYQSAFEDEGDGGGGERKLSHAQKGDPFQKGSSWYIHKAVVSFLFVKIPHCPTSIFVTWHGSFSIDNVINYFVCISNLPRIFFFPFLSFFLIHSLFLFISTRSASFCNLQSTLLHIWIYKRENHLHYHHANQCYSGRDIDVYNCHCHPEWIHSVLWLYLHVPEREALSLRSM